MEVACGRECLWRDLRRGVALLCLALPCCVQAGATAHKMATAHANMDVTCLLMEHDCKGKVRSGALRYQCAEAVLCSARTVSA